MPKTNNPTAKAGLWRFSLRVYRKPGMAEACLGLQDRHGLDVNLLLYAAYAAVSGRGAVDTTDLATADRAIADRRRQVVEPLRRLRRELKGIASAAQLRQRVLAAELMAEREAQRLLAERLGPPGKRSPEERRADLTAALDCVARRARPELAGAGRKAMAIVARVCLAEIAQPRRRRVGPLPSPQRRTRPASRPKRSSTRPTE